MGLDTSHDCWHGAYSAFTRWRNILAETAGYEVVVMDGYIPQPKIVAAAYWTDKNFQGEWPDGPPEDPLLILLVHSDCDGVIKAAHAPFLADRLERLLPEIAEDLDGGGHVGFARETTQKFIDGLRAAADAGEDVDFY